MSWASPKKYVKNQMHAPLNVPPGSSCCALTPATALAAPPMTAATTHRNATLTDMEFSSKVLVPQYRKKTPERLLDLGPIARGWFARHAGATGAARAHRSVNR